MKRYLALAVLVFILAIGGLKSYQHRHANDPIDANHPATLQAQTSHMLGILDSPKDDEPIGYCTGTVIGPHAILTAEHCNKGKALQLDFSQRAYTIQKVLRDHRDHVIYLVDGPAFYNIQPYEARTARLGEEVHIYGFGGRNYPGQYRTGTVLDEYDPSEVDQADGINYYSMPSIPGDSGSAVYSNDGAIVGVVTYGISAPATIGAHHYMAGFTLNFTPEQIQEAQTYQETQDDVINELDTPAHFNLRNPFNN